MLIKCLQIQFKTKEDGVKVSKAMVTKAKKGQSTAMVTIAGKYAPKHIYDKAFEWHLLAANNNNIDAFLQVGNHYFRGEGVEKNYLNAIEWYLKYIDLSRNTKTTVLSNIVDMFSKGLGVPANEVKAHEWNQINENQTFSFMVGGVAGLPKESKVYFIIVNDSIFLFPIIQRRIWIC
jgi:4-hydroxyphenylpyruvate dioxygenase-like putative hemolysin